MLFRSLKYLFDNELDVNTKEWDVKLWAKRAKNEISKIEGRYEPNIDALRVKMMDHLQKGDMDAALDIKKILNREPYFLTV